ncbi:hypothetical protein EG328_003427 [Venturia inaequalis]|uniref:Uncharacterized protein n=1 Tax=Venturia inaequalis TaxID=5025 RepID=A0A8H3ZBI4_VENIN|nr:hypothetical protein EG328_003427 [Venturia inaequalis]KAE9990173.1 hypothetical protein EG327_001813 [Venturia inaequalis]
MFGFKQLLVLALAGSALACQCRQDGVRAANKRVDVSATEEACTNAHGTLYNAGTVNVECAAVCNRNFFDECLKLQGQNSDIPDIRSTCRRDNIGCR